jgi:peptidyl-prolyl cis-trans isomerase B (cyclophilin B)
MKKAILLVLALFISIAPSIAQTIKQKVEISTSYGTMTIGLYEETPLHRDNFIKLASDGFYDELLFHRVINGFMIQGGDPDSRNAAADKSLGAGGPNYTVPAEFNKNLYHKKGALCAARTGNPEKASSSCQFYIAQGKKLTDAELDSFESRLGIKYSDEQRKVYKTIGGIPSLDQNYTVYGEVIEGMDVIDKIATVETNKGLGDRPVKDVKMTVKVLK